MGKKSRRREKRAGAVEERLREGRAEVDALLERGRTQEAKKALLRLDSRHPGQVEVLDELAELAYQTEDTQYLQAAMERLSLVRPEVPEVLLSLGAAALSNHYAVTALKALRTALAKWPRHPFAEETRRVVQDLEAAVPEKLAELGVEGEQGEWAMLQEERTLHLMSLGLTRKAREVAMALYTAQPHFTAALNNFATAAWMDGDYAEAEAASRKVLAAHPENVHALAGLIRLLVLTGRLEEARELATRLKASTAPASERWLAMALALTYLGDDEGVLWAYEQEKREGSLHGQPMGARLRHLAAVAAMRKGDSRRARRLWEKALEEQPELESARLNLEALDLPAPLRAVPWAVELEGWLPAVKWEAFRRRLASDRKAVSPRWEERVLEHFPELRHLVPLLLDRGEPTAVTLVLALCEVMARDAQVDASLAAELRRFCLGERGHVAERFKAGRVLLKVGAAREEELLLWTGLRRQPYGWFDFELHEEPARGPEDFVARCEGVQLRASQGHLEEARALLEPLLNQRRLHRSEFAALCAAHMDLLHAEGDREAALVWLDFLENFLPKHPFVAGYSEKLDAPPTMFGSFRVVLGMRRAG